MGAAVAGTVPGSAWAIACGDTLTASVTLTADLDCTGYSGPAALIIAGSGVTLDGDGYKLLVGPASDYGVWLQFASNATVTELEIDSAGYAAVYLGGAANATISHNIFRNSRLGLVSDNSNTSLDISSNQFVDHWQFSLVFFSVPLDVNVANNSFQGSGVELGPPSAPWTWDNAVTPNSFTISSGPAVAVNDGEITLANFEVTGTGVSGGSQHRGFLVNGGVVTIEDPVVTGFQSGLFVTTGADAVVTGGASRRGRSGRGSGSRSTRGRRWSSAGWWPRATRSVCWPRTGR